MGDGRTLECDLVVVGIGALPRTALAINAGLAVENGIVVDSHLRTGVPCGDRIGLLNVLLAEGLNLGLRKMAEACNTHDYWQLSRLARWHVESEAIDSAGHANDVAALLHDLWAFDRAVRAALDFQARAPGETLVIVADPGDEAIRVYRSVGFDGTETQVQLLRKPPGHA